MHQATNFERAQALLLSENGRITQHRFSSWLARHSFRERRIETITDLEALAILLEAWEKYNCDRLVLPWALVVIDAAMNLREGMSARLENSVLAFSGKLALSEIDFEIGSRSIAALNQAPELARAALLARLGYAAAKAREPSELAKAIEHLSLIDCEIASWPHGPRSDAS